MQSLRKHIAVVLLVLTAMPLLYIGFFTFRQQQVKRQMEQQLKTASLTTLEIPVASLRWVCIGKELLVDGALFDVKHIVQEKGIAIITGLFDNAETAQKEKINRLINEDSNPGQEAALQFLLLPLYHDVSTVQLLLSDSKGIIPVSHYRYSKLCSHPATVPTPPPDNSFM